MFTRWRKLAKHLEESGVRGPATVVEISSMGTETRSEGFNPMSMLGKRAGDTLAPDGGYIVRKARLRVRPEGEPEFEVERDFR